MSFLGFKKKKKESGAPAAALVPTPVSTKKLAVKDEKREGPSDGGVPLRAGGKEWVILRPRITEKGSMLSSRGAYAFDVSPRATKRDVAEAIRATYGVFPRAIAIVKVPAKTVFVRGRAGVRSGGKKAYVYLKEGEKIEII